ncbi:DUF1697 domain-containing protein [Nocardioides sp. GXZ039]|uniref:DUF1697 domain-containing protein n=1 Tax=Nocardioides sp. GXZ039 TaxID=3136018 RepID=UPI0030F467C7
MATYVALLRAINLGARRKFPKEAIIAATEGAGFTDVATHINTGNVRLATTMRSLARIEERLETAYAADRGFEVPSIVFPVAELRGIAADADAIGEGHAGRHYVSFLRDEPDAEARAALEERSSEAERVVLRGRAVHLLLGENYHEARLNNAVVERHLGVATNRNVTVLRALAQRWC